MSISKIICHIFGHSTKEIDIEALKQGLPDGYGQVFIICYRCKEVIEVKHYIEITHIAKEQLREIYRKYGLNEKEYFSIAIDFYMKRDLFSPHDRALFLKYLKERFKAK